MKVRELGIPLGIMLAVASIILPLPVWLIDLLLVTNLVLAIVLLVSSLYLRDPLELSALPSMLLLAALFRLSLNISTTRLILGAEESSKMIEAFGEVVIAGNLVLGMILFLVITVVQFIVVAKGAERVAEVSARFTLDAMPGRQMAIDADLRTGILDFSEARKKRSELQAESRFYGALDGAMKFVKGDSLAGLIIIGINLLAGILIGTVLHGVPISNALSRYSLLTVGDGLLSQIPALLSALAAGMVVTRVGSESDSLVSELTRQLGQLKGVRVVIGLGLICTGIFSSLPFLPFMTVGVALIALTIMARDSIEPGSAQEDLRPSLPEKICLLIHPADLGSAIVTDLEAVCAKVRTDFFKNWGVVLPAINQRSTGLRKGYISVAIRELKVAEIEIEAEETPDTALLRILDKQRLEFVDDNLSRYLLEAYQSELPELSQGVVPGVCSITMVTSVLRMLLEEEVSVSNFDLILQAIAEAKPESPLEALAFVRKRLATTIEHSLPESGGKRLLAVLNPELELKLAESVDQQLVIEPELLSGLTAEVERLGSDDITISVGSAVRRYVWELLGIGGLSSKVVSLDEAARFSNSEVVKELPLSFSAGAMLREAA